MDISILSNEDKEALKNSFLFKDVSWTVTEAALKDKRCVLCEYEEGQLIMDRSSFIRALFFVLSGTADAAKVTEETQIPLRSIGRYDFFGAAALFNGDDKYISRITAVKKTRLIVLPQEIITGLIIHHSRIALNYIEFLTKRVRYLDAKINLFVSTSGKNALINYLCTRLNSSAVVRTDIPLTALAARLNMSRASLYRALNLLEESGLIKRNGRDIIITDPEGLLKAKGGK